MWIKTPNGKLVNMDALTAAQIYQTAGKTTTVLLTVRDIQVSVSFEKAEEARSWYEKLEARLEAKEL